VSGRKSIGSSAFLARAWNGADERWAPYFVEFLPGYGLHQGYLPGVPRVTRMH